MTPKEKAEKMVLMFEQCQSKEIIGVNHDTAVRSALICVDEILKTDPLAPSKFDSTVSKGEAYGKSGVEAYNYWHNVKQEILKL